MGEHKRNPVAIAAKRGELPPKEPKMSKAEIDGILYAKIREIMCRPIVEAYAKMRKGGAE